MSMVHINWKPDTTELRKFGVAMIVGFAIIGSLFLWRGESTIAYGCYIFGAVAGLLGLSGTKIALPVYWAWMSIAFVLGNIISRILLSLFFYLLITPMGLVMRLSGRDKLQLKRREADSYWVDLEVPEDPADFERQF